MQKAAALLTGNQCVASASLAAGQFVNIIDVCNSIALHGMHHTCSAVHGNHSWTFQKQIAADDRWLTQTFCTERQLLLQIKPAQLLLL
jgi:hypothetical protein